MTVTTPAKTAMSLALTVGLDRPESWGDNCVAWVDSADRKCGKPRKHGYLCTRHHNVATKRLAKRIEKKQEWAERRRAHNEKKLPEWKAALEKVNAELAHRTGSDQDRLEPAAYLGQAHASITKARQATTKRLFSDANVERVGELIRTKELLETQIRNAEQ